MTYCKAVATSILFCTSVAWLSLGTINRIDDLAPSRDFSVVPLLNGWKRWGVATVASRVSYGKYEGFGKPKDR